MNLRKMKFGKGVKLMRVYSFLNKRTMQEPSGGFRLKGDGLVALVEVYAARELLVDNNDQSLSPKENLLMISQSSNQMANIVRLYVNKLIELLPEYVKEEFLNLESHILTNESVFEDKAVLSFVQEYICDEINLLRNFEFGKFVIFKLSQYVFSGLEPESLNKFEKEVKNSTKSFDEDIYDRIFLKIRNLKEFEFITLLAVYNYKFNKGKITAAYTYDYALRFKENGLSLNIKMSLFKKISKEIVNHNNLRKDRSQGPQR